jgi:protein kinase C substrate 80K-H
LIEIVEIQTRVVFDKNRDGIVSIEEAKYFLDEHDQVDFNTFVAQAWPCIKPFLMMGSGLFKPPAAPETEGVEEYQETEDHAELENDPADELTGQQEDVGEGEVVETTTKSPIYDPLSQDLIEQASDARHKFSAADRELRDIETEIKNIQDLLAKDYGPDEEFAPLYGECFNHEDREYIYKLCPFDKAIQQPKQGGSETRLGTWERWSGADDNKYSSMLYSNWAGCWNGPQRSTSVEILCGLENQLTAVSEPNRCEYHCKFETPSACNLNLHAKMYAFRVQTFAISCAARFCNDHQQSTRTIATSVWTTYGKSMLLIWTTVCGLLARWKTFRFFRVHLYL